jgi:hypothetical protein
MSLKVVYTAMGIDIWEVINAAKTKPFGFMPFYPGPGLGGHCIPIDPFYLTWKAREYVQNTRFIELAGEINSAMPEYVIQQVVAALNSRRKALNGSKVLVLGLAYKADVDDDRESPSYVLMTSLKERGARGFILRSVCSGHQIDPRASAMGRRQVDRMGGQNDQEFRSRAHRHQTCQRGLCGAGPMGRLHRRYSQRHGRHPDARWPGLQSLNESLRGIEKESVRQTRLLAGHGGGRFHRLQLAGSAAARLGQTVTGLDNLSTGHAENLAQVRAAVGTGLLARISVGSKATFATPRSAGASRAGWITFCTKPRWVRCPALWRIR